ncbi:MAG TPA: hypothetical protein DDY98_09475, partial [Ruminococcaceae bacterium]|nr:hypothetical protein [Oscillospiraceae bacterium]
VEPEPPVEEHETDFAPLEVPQVGDVFTKADESEDGQIPSDFMKRMNHYIQVQQYDTDERVKQAQEHGKAKEEQKDYSAFATPLKERKPTTERKWEKKPVVLMEDDDELEALLSRSLDDVMRDKKEEKP